MNVGVIELVITISIVTVAAQDTNGVKVYWVVPVADVFIVEGIHTPGTPLLDVDGSEGGVEFWHNGPIWVKVGVTLAVIVISILNTAVHCPAFGIKVYDNVPTEDVLITAGLQVPATPLFDVAGNAGAVEF